MRLMPSICSRSLSLEPILLKFWYKQNNKQLIFLFKPLELLYKLIITIRSFFYKIKLFKSYHPGIPVIVVGNITVGGTGKTPFVIALAKLLHSHGYHPAVILRGYNAKKKKSEELIVVDHSTSVQLCGDEAKLIFNKLNCPVVVGSDRLKAAQYLVQNNLCNIIISDDGLQHYRLQRDIEICVIDSVRKFGNNQLLPVGPLRESLKRLNKVDYIVIRFNDLGNIEYNKGIDNLKESIGLVDLKFSQKVYAFNFQASNLCNLNSNVSVNFDYLTNNYNKIYIISGIGNNQSFIDSIDRLNLSNFNVNIVSYADHYTYNIWDFDIINDPSNSVVTTEKDAVKMLDFSMKLPYFQNIFYLKACVELPDEFCQSILIASKSLVEKYYSNCYINYKTNHKTNLKTSLEENTIC